LTEVGRDLNYLMFS